MDRNDQLSPATEANIVKSSGSGWTLVGLGLAALAYGLVTAGGFIGQAIVVSLVVGTALQLARRLSARR